MPQTSVCHQYFGIPWPRAALLSRWRQSGSVAQLRETADQHDKSGLGGWPSYKKRVTAARLLLMTRDYMQRSSSV